MLIPQTHRQEGRHYRIQWSNGTRIENANLLQTKGGNFEGVYFEIGVGEKRAVRTEEGASSPRWTVSVPCLPQRFSFDSLCGCSSIPPVHFTRRKMSMRR